MAGTRETRRERAGKDATVGGAPAADALSALVSQFTERTSFVRELIQNSLDAGSGRIDVLVKQEGRSLHIQITDDGEGMDREIIEGYLLTLFRSTKEKDLTKIGKFGVGFVSLFAIQPTMVTVDTGRDGVHHRVIFDKDQNYTLAEVDEPFEGTTVSLWVSTWGKEAVKLAREIRNAVHYWCRYARAEVTVEGRGSKLNWPLETVTHPFTVNTPVEVEEQGDGFRAVLGFTTEDPPPVGYYNRGLTLLESRESVIPGVTFRVEAKALEHTLTRDNVIRDSHYASIIKRIRRVAETRLRDAHIAALRALEPGGDPAHHRALLIAAQSPAFSLPDDLSCLRSASGKFVSLKDLSLGMMGHLSKTDEVLWAPGPSTLVTALEASGHTVLLGPPDKEPEIHLVRTHHTAYDLETNVERVYVCPTRVDSHPLVEAAAKVDAEHGERLKSWTSASFAGGGATLPGRLARLQESPCTVEPVTHHGRAMVINVFSHAFVRLAKLPIDIAAPLLVIAAYRYTKIPLFDSYVTLLAKRARAHTGSKS